MIKRLFCLLVFLAIIAGCQKGKNRCEDFKTGTFRFVKPDLKRFKIVRNESTQTETDSITGLTITGNVDWTSDCGYKVKYTKVSDPKYNEVIGTETKFEILAVFDNKLTVKSVGLGGTMESEMIKVSP